MDEKTILKRIRQDTLEYTFKEGSGGILLLVGVIACGILWLFLDLWIWSLVAAVICSIGGYLVYRDYLKSSVLRKTIIERIIFEIFPLDTFEGSEHTRDLLKNRNYCTEVVAKILNPENGRRENGLKAQVLEDIFVMFEWQQKLTQQLIELEKALKMVSTSYFEDKASQIYIDNIESIKEAISESIEEINDINEKFKTLILQVALIQKDSGDIEDISKFAKITSRTVDKAEMISSIQKKTKAALKGFHEGIKIKL